MKGVAVAAPYLVVSRATSESYSGWTDYNILGVSSYDFENFRAIEDGKMNTETFLAGFNGRLLVDQDKLAVRSPLSLIT